MPGARDVALTVLMRVEQGGAYAAPVLTKTLEGISDRREAAFATELTLGVLRRRPHLDQLLESASRRGLGKLDPKTRQILRIGAYQIAFLPRVPVRAVVSEAVEQTRRQGAAGLTGLVNALLRNIAARTPDSLRPDEGDFSGSNKALSVRLGLPIWLTRRLVEAYGPARAATMAAGFNRPSRRTLRVNTRRISPEKLIETEEGHVSHGRLTPWSVDAARPDVAARIMADGRAVHQDEGAGLVALAVDPRPGERILDACAGRGGKTGALAMMLSGKAEIVAVDRSESKLERLMFELERQGFEATPVPLDLLGRPQPSLGLFDRVLLDAPCSGTGTIGRRPEIRWRLKPASVASLVQTQSAMLARAAQLVRPGGRLVYAVCSLLPEEGLEQGRQFLAGHPGWQAVERQPANWPDEIPWNRGSVFVDPSVGETDGYQICCFEKTE